MPSVACENTTSDDRNKSPAVCASASFWALPLPFDAYAAAVLFKEKSILSSLSRCGCGGAVAVAVVVSAMVFSFSFEILKHRDCVYFFLLVKVNIPAVRRPGEASIERV